MPSPPNAACRTENQSLRNHHAGDPAGEQRRQHGHQAIDQANGRARRAWSLEPESAGCRAGERTIAPLPMMKHDYSLRAACGTLDDTALLNEF